MSATPTPEKTAPKRRWLKRLGLVAGVLVLLLVVAFLVVTSGAFLKGVVLPRVGTAINAKVSADTVALSPFSSLSVTGLKVETTGTEPLVTLKDFRVRYSLSDILGGKITVDELTLDSPAIHLVLNADGTSNLDPILKGSSEPKKKSKPGATPQLAIRNVQLKDALVHVVHKQRNGADAVYEISGFNVSLDQLVNGAKSTIKIAAALKGQQSGTNAFSLVGSLATDLTADLTADLLPKQASGTIKLGLSDATGSLAPAKGFQIALNTDLTPIDLRDLSLSVLRNADTLATLKVSGPFDASKLEGRLKLALNGVDRRLLGFVQELTGTDFGNASLAMNADINLADGGKQVELLGNLDGKALSVKPAGGTATPPADLNVGYNVQLKNDVAELKGITLAPTLNGHPGGRINVTGRYDLKAGTGTITLQMVGLNQDLVNPFMGGTIAGRDLVSMTLGGDATVQLGAGGSIGLKAGLGISNLVTRVTGTTAEDAPLRLGLTTDLGLNGPVIDLRDLTVQLPSTTNAANKLTLSGKVDQTKPDAISGQLTLTSDALDFTPVYDLLAGGPAATNTPAKSPAPATNEEPDPVVLPVGDFTIAAKIGRIHLREVTVTNLVLNTRVTPSTIVVKPLTLSLNGAPVSANADLDLGVKGWRYDVGLKLDRVPARPFADSFLTDRRGQFDGTVMVDANLKGAGTTGINLKKSLAGGASFSLTNVNIQVVSEKWKPVLTVIGLALRITDIAQSPLNAIYSDVRFGGGNIDLKGFTVESEAFRANATAVVPIADVLNDSPLNDVPLKLELRRSLAQKANLLPDNTPADAKYAAIQDFVKLKGTLGKPEAEIDKGVVTLMILKSTPAGSVVNAAGGILKTGTGAVGNVLGGLLGTGGTNTTGTATNAPTGSTNAAPKNPLDGLLNPFRR